VLEERRVFRGCKGKGRKRKEVVRSRKGSKKGRE